jgi:hypothetical protein
MTKAGDTRGPRHLLALRAIDSAGGAVCVWYRYRCRYVVWVAIAIAKREAKRETNHVVIYISQEPRLDMH